VPLTISEVKDVANANNPIITMALSMNLGDIGTEVGKTVANKRKATAIIAEDAKARRAQT